MGRDTQRNANASGIDETFLQNLYESFNQEYQFFNLLCQFGAATMPVLTPIQSVNTTNATSEYSDRPCGSATTLKGVLAWWCEIPQCTIV